MPWIAERPSIPTGYGMPKGRKGLLPWSYVDDSMSRAHHYWVCTASADGVPHAAPVDGIWLDERLYFGGSPQAQWVRNAVANSALRVHLESATEVVIIDGTLAELTGADLSLAERLAEASNVKYGYGATPESYMGGGPAPIYVFHPTRAVGWRQFPADATRWRRAQ
jgi:hypothetical protein